MKIGNIKRSVLLSLALLPLWAGAVPRSAILQQTLSDEDTATLLEAIEATPSIPAIAAPKQGLFYSARYGANCPPMPGNMGLPVWRISDDVFLIDDLNTANSSRVQTDIAMGIPSPGDGGANYDGSNGSGGSSGCDYSFDTNALWLELTNFANGYASGNLHNTTNLVYAILSNTNLLYNDWNIEQAIWPHINQNVIPFALDALDRKILFLRAKDLTGVTHNGNVIPDWWFWTYFGTTDLSDTNLDSQGNTLLSDYQNGSDPNVIGFTISVTNNYFNTYAPVQLNITAGFPKFIAILVDDTNFVANAIWHTYGGTNIAVNLGQNEGWHNVWIGLRGLSGNSKQTWQHKRLKLDVTCPLLVITCPLVSTVDVPVIQLKGFCPETLASISYDLNNTTGLATSQQILVINQDYSTNTMETTTNRFQAYDVVLTKGVNEFTLRATDLAGNNTMTNFNITVDYSSKTNPPTVRLDWPQNGVPLCGTNFTCNGWVRACFQIIKLNIPAAANVHFTVLSS